VRTSQCDQVMPSGMTRTLQRKASAGSREDITLTGVANVAWAAHSTHRLWSRTLPHVVRPDRTSAQLSCQPTPTATPPASCATTLAYDLPSTHGSESAAARRTWKSRPEPRRLAPASYDHASGPTRLPRLVAQDQHGASIGSPLPGIVCPGSPSASKVCHSTEGGAGCGGGALEARRGCNLAAT